MKKQQPQPLIKSGSMGLSDTVELKWLDEKRSLRMKTTRGIWATAKRTARKYKCYPSNQHSLNHRKGDLNINR